MTTLLEWYPEYLHPDFHSGYVTPLRRECVGSAAPRGVALLGSRLNRAGFEDRTFPTQAEAKAYIENCYTLWIASGGGV